MRIVASLILLIVVASYSFAQTACTQKLNQAEDDFEAGRLLGIPNVLSDCLSQDGFTKEEEIRARKLLTLVYIFTDQEGKAESALIQLLHVDPEHRLNPEVDPAELFFLMDQFRVEPIFRIGVKAGVNFTSIDVIQSYGPLNENYGTKFYNGDGAGGTGIGFSGEITAERHLLKGIEIGLGVQARLTKYNVEQRQTGDFAFSSLPLNTQVSHQQLYLRTPVLVRYNIGYQNRDNRIVPYVYLGGSFDYLLDAQYATLTRSPGTTYNLPANDAKFPAGEEMVGEINYSVFGGVGFKLRVATHFLTVEARYDNSLMNYINGDNRYSGSQQSVFDAAYVEDDIGLNVLSFSVGWTHSIYSPKKLKEYR